MDLKEISEKLEPQIAHNESVLCDKSLSAEFVLFLKNKTKDRQNQ